MDIESQFPYQYYLNLGESDIRRNKLLFRLGEINLHPKRNPGINARLVKRRSGDFANDARRAQMLGHRLAIRKARQAKASAVLLLEDDVVFPKNLRQLFGSLTLPEDWGVFFFGCVHLEKPDVVSAELVKVTRAAGTHAMAIHSRFFQRLLKEFSRVTPAQWSIGGFTLSRDFFCEVPCYAAYPNLIWQDSVRSIITGRVSDAYDPSGLQIHHNNNTEDLPDETIEAE